MELEEIPMTRPTKAADAPEIVAIFEVEKETKNTVKFAETPNENGVTFIGSLYVQKAAGMVLGALGDGAELEVIIRKRQR